MKKYIIITMFVIASFSTSVHAMFHKFVPTKKTGNTFGGNAKYTAKKIQQPGTPNMYAENVINQQRIGAGNQDNKGKSTRTTTAKFTSDRQISSTFVTPDGAVVTLGETTSSAFDSELEALLQDIASENLESEGIAETDEQSTLFEDSRAEKAIRHASDGIGLIIEADESTTDEDSRAEKAIKHESEGIGSTAETDEQATHTESSTAEGTIAHNKFLHKEMIKKIFSIAAVVGVVSFVGYQFSKQYKKHTIA